MEICRNSRPHAIRTSGNIFRKSCMRALQLYRRTSILSLAFFLLSLSTMLFANDFVSHKVDYHDRKMEYLSFVPPSNSDHPLPVLLLLHGAGDEAINFIQPWKALAQKKNIVLI